jgi:hypothetical protein
MYVGEGNSGGGRPERPRGTRFAAELDRRLASDEPLHAIIDWWNDERRRVFDTLLTFASASGDVSLVEEFQPGNFSDNEHSVFLICILSGCSADDRATQLHWFWPKIGLDAAKMTDPAYAHEAMGRFIDRLLAARVELRRNSPC